jgi:hypothetical protein
VRVLALVLSCAKYRERLDAVLATWAARAPPWVELRFCADSQLAGELGAAFWPCAQTGGALDKYDALPIKMLDGFRRARELRWDWLLKIDDDCYLDWERLGAFLGTLDARRPIYVGTGYHWDLGHEGGDQWMALAGGPFRAHFGPTYLLSRAALEKAWAPLELAFLREGAEDMILSAVAHRFGLEVIGESHLFFGFEPRRITHGCAVSVLLDAPASVRATHEAAKTKPAAPRIVSAWTAWGEVGTGGWLGYHEASGDEVIVSGQKRARAVSAHAPSRLVLLLEPGEEVRLTGALNDSAVGANARASFRVESRDGTLIADLGIAKLNQPTHTQTLRAPADGLIALCADTDQQWHSHSVWLFE